MKYLGTAEHASEQLKLVPSKPTNQTNAISKPQHMRQTVQKSGKSASTNPFIKEIE